MELALAVYEEITGTTPLPAIPGEDSDRRKHRRMPFGFRATILPTRRGVEGPASVVLVRDISLAGISFLNEDSLKNGTTFVIEFKGQRERPVKIRCTTVRCEQGGTGGTQYVIGSTFDEMITKELPPLPKDEPLPPLSDQSHIRGRLIKADSEIAHHTGAADGFSDNSGPAPAAPFSVTSQPEPDQPMIELTRIYGRLIRPNSEFDKNGNPIDRSPATPSDGVEQLSDQAHIPAKAATPQPQPEMKLNPTPSVAHAPITSAPASAADATTSDPMDEEAAALAMLLAEPDDSLDGFTLEDTEENLSEDTSILEMLAEAGSEKTAEPEPEPEPETASNNQARILGRLTKSEPEPEKKPAPKSEPTTPPNDQARILGRLTKSDAEPEKKPAPTAPVAAGPAAPIKILEPATKPAAKSEPKDPPSDQARILGRLSKTEAEPEKKPAPKPAAPAAPQPTAKAIAKVETENPTNDHASLLNRLAKTEPEAETKPAPAPIAPAAQKVQPEAAKPEPAAKAETPAKPELVAKTEAVAKPAPKPEFIAPPTDHAKLAERLTKTSPEPEIKRVPQVAASEDAAAAKPIAKATPAPAAPAAPPWSNASKPSAPAEQKLVVISRSQGKGVNAMSLAHTESTSEQPVTAKTDVVTGVKALLMQQRETLKKQEHELETLRAELAQAKRKCAQLQAKADADAKAMTELEAFLTKEAGDNTGDNESIAA